MSNGPSADKLKESIKVFTELGKLTFVVTVGLVGSAVVYGRHILSASKNDETKLEIIALIVVIGTIVIFGLLTFFIFYQVYKNLRKL